MGQAELLISFFTRSIEGVRRSTFRHNKQAAEVQRTKKRLTVKERGGIKNRNCRVFLEVKKYLGSILEE